MNSFIEILNQWGGNFLSFAWPMLWQSSLLITALFVFDLLLRRKLRASIRYALWLIVLVKLCVPPTLALPTSPVWWLHKTPPHAVAKPSRHYMITYDEGPLSEMPQIPLPAFVPPQPAMTNAAWLLAVSAAVSSALLIWLLARWWQITRLVRRAAASERLTAICDAAQKFVGLNLKVQVKLTTNAMSPAVCGLFRPAILIPQSLAENFSNEQLHAVLLHELIHLRRRDVWLNFVQALLQIIYWWHPLVWLANARIRRVREEAVDDAVMLSLRDEAESYAPTLLEVAKLALNRPLASLGLVGILESRHALRQRIERLVDFHPPHRAGLTLVSLLGILAFTAVAVPMGDGPSPEETQTLPVAPVPTPKPIEQKTNLPSVLIQGFIYQMRDVDFDKIVSGLKFNPAETGRDPWWSASPEKFSQLMANLKSSGLQPITRPRIQTSSGIPASMYFGDGTNGLEFDCSPIVVGGIVDLAIQGKLVDAKGSEAVTNEFNAKTSVDNYGGIVIRTKNIGGSGESNVVVITGVQLVTNIPTSLYQQIMPARTTNVTGVLTDPNFRTALHALTEQQGVESLPEPEVVTTSGHGINIARQKRNVIISEGRQEIIRKLQTIRLDRVAFEAVPLNEVVRTLSGETKKLDPDHRGINFLINPYSEQTAAPTIDPSTGLPIAPSAGNLSKMISIPITINPPLTNIGLGDVLNALVKAAPEPIRYTIQDYAIVISPGKPPVSLYSRHFKVDANKFMAAMRNMPGIKTNNISVMAEDFFKTLGVDWESPKGKSIFYNVRLGELFVRATSSDLDIIEQAIEVLVSASPQNSGTVNHVLQGNSNAGQLVQDGKLLYEMGKLDEAEVKLKAALALEPENAAAKYYLGLVQAARQHSTIHQTKTGRQSIADKLEQIRLPLFGPFMAANLGDAVRQLNEMARQNDPEKTGVNFVILTNSLSSQPAGIDSVIINLTVPLMNVTLGDALDAMTLVTDKPIKYSILDDMIVLSMKDGSDIPALYSRHFRIDANTFIAAMQNASGIKTNNIPAMAKDFFKTLGVDLDVPGKSVFYGDRLGELFVRATKQDLDTIESSMKPFISVAPQIHIKARFLEVPKGTLDGLENVIAVTNQTGRSNQAAGLVGILTDKNFRSVLRDLEARPDVETLAEPEVVTTSGRQTHMRETVISTIITNFVFEENLTNSWFRPQTSPIETGSKLDVIPIVLADGITIYLQTTASQTEFLGYAHIPKNTPLHSVTNSAGEEIDLPLIWPAMQISRESAHVNLHDGQTLILSLNRPEQIRFGEPDPKREAVVAKHIRDSQKKNKGGAREIIVFVTATFVDPAGNRIHSDEDLPFAKDSTPSQPK